MAQYPQSIVSTSSQGSYSNIAKLAMTHRRIDQGFRKKIQGRYKLQQYTSSDNPLIAQSSHSDFPPKYNPVKTHQTMMKTTELGRNTLMGGQEIQIQHKTRIVPKPSLQLLQQYDRKHILPSARNIQPRKRYIRNDSLTLEHIFEPLSDQKQQPRYSDQMKDLLAYKFASHGSEKVSPKITQAAFIGR